MDKGEKLCQRCGKEPVGKGRVKYCDACAEKDWLPNVKLKSPPILCAWCRERPRGRNKNKYCDVCAPIVRAYQAREQSRRKAEKERLKRAEARAKREAEGEKKKPAPAVVKCRGCVYYRRLSSGNSCSAACHYALDTGVLRKIPPAECYKHEGTPYTPKKPKA